MEQFLDGTWKFGASKLVKHQDGAYYFHLCCARDIETREVTESSTFMGVDVGQNFLAVASTTDRKCRFFCGGKARDLRNIYSTMRKRLQSKGTRSAKRMLKHLSGRERRLMTDMNHRISKEIVEFAVQNKVDVIGLEDLSGVRDRTETSKKQRYTHHWAFFELQSFIEYKAREIYRRYMSIQPIPPRPALDATISARTIGVEGRLSANAAGTRSMPILSVLGTSSPEHAPTGTTWRCRGAVNHPDENYR